MLQEYNDSIVLSICVMSYNRGDMLLDAIQEILEYEGDDIEIVISDNASTDGTWELLNDIHDKRVRIYRNEKNMGMLYNSMHLFTLAKGKYVMLMTDRDRINMKELFKFIKILEKIDKEVIVANNIKYLKSELATYQQRVYESIKDAGHPGHWIYSRTLLEKADSKLHGKWTSQDPTEQVKSSSTLLNLYCQSNSWFCYCGESLIIIPSLEKLATIQSNRLGNIITPQVYFGLEARLNALKKRIELTDITKKQEISFIKGVYAGNVFRIFEEFHWTINQPDLCKRYNYVPPKHVWWLRNGMLFGLRTRQYLVKTGKCNKDLDKYLFWEMWRQYIAFKKHTSKSMWLLLNSWKLIKSK